MRSTLCSPKESRKQATDVHRFSQIFIDFLISPQFLLVLVLVLRPRFFREIEDERDDEDEDEFGN